MPARLPSVLSTLLLVAALAGSALAQPSGEAPPAGGSSAPAPNPPAPNPPAPPPVAPPAAQAPAPPVPTEQGTPAIVLSPEESEGIIGKNVRSVAGEDMGRIVDIIVSASNQPRAAIIDFGGFLGVGSRKIAVDWRLLQYSRTGRTWAVTSALSRNQVRGSPEYKPGEPVVVLGLPAAAQPPPPSAQAPAAPPAPPPPSVQASQPPAASPAAPATPAPAPSNPPSNGPGQTGASGQETQGEPPRPPQ